MTQEMLTEQTEQDQSFLISTFYLGKALLGIDTLRVQEIMRVSKLTVVHHCPEYILGVINLRGRIVTILDLARKLRLHQEPNPDDGGRVIIVDFYGEYIGLMVDRVADVIGAERKDIQPPPSNVGGVQGHFIEGIYSNNQNLIAILNVEEVLADQE